MLNKMNRILETSCLKSVQVCKYRSSVQSISTVK